MLSMKLPNVTVRKAEVDAIVAILESVEYDDSNKMARALLKETYGLLLARDWYTVARRNGGFNLLYGFFATENAAIKAMPKLEVDGECAIFKVRSASERADRVGELIDAPAKSSTKCKRCSHEVAGHELPRYNGRCADKTCRCTKFVPM